MAKKMTSEMLDAMREEYLAFGPLINDAAANANMDLIDKLQEQQASSDWGRLFTRYIEQYLKPGGDKLTAKEWALKEFG